MEVPKPLEPKEEIVSLFTSIAGSRLFLASSDGSLACKN